ncbi:hypothetical protein MBM_07988 [Drepanopeziza brunnea f. sp. 'multigermtubi' MB_m1]|uniref:Uncharacterized protein n=1 Tax=Marssonina brunnea f. sp. multigermtubi (strain MB_m1) TaxID=1072389 RepID=K1WN83_MARBU|nr:uncharacterized protein MBM_07988 [Drepanopeziza brunnea f. sp. 'multigermtubi' MB_m1]EKD13787.1 hypothetical protein MBM_07988 [Drepanopeziza brunnea f. sp. 'multigermtubi' MB_m1]
MSPLTPTSRAAASVMKHIERVQKARRQVRPSAPPVAATRQSTTSIPSLSPVPRIGTVSAPLPAALPQRLRADGTGSRIPGPPPSAFTRRSRHILSFPLRISPTPRPTPRTIQQTTTSTETSVPPPLKSAIRRGPTSLAAKSVHFEDPVWIKAEVRVFPREDSDFGNVPWAKTPAHFYPAGPRPHIQGVGQNITVRSPPSTRQPQFWRHSGTFFAPHKVGVCGEHGQIRPGVPTSCEFCAERYALGAFLPKVLDDINALEDYTDTELCTALYDESKAWHLCEGCEEW